MKQKFEYAVEQFADLQVLRYQVPGFEDLSLRQKQLVFYLSEAALQGRDILFDQNGCYNLRIRRLLEAVYLHYKGNLHCPVFEAFEVYLTRVWFSNGIYHHYACDKIMPGCSEAFFRSLVDDLPDGQLPLRDGETRQDL